MRVPPFYCLERGFYSWHSGSRLGRRGRQPCGQKPSADQGSEGRPEPRACQCPREPPSLLRLPAPGPLTWQRRNRHLVRACTQSLAAWLTATEENTGRGNSRFTAVSTQNPELFSHYHLFMIALFSTRTTANLHLPRPVLADTPTPQSKSACLLWTRNSTSLLCRNSFTHLMIICLNRAYEKTPA